jgi:hypothetical protein
MKTWARRIGAAIAVLATVILSIVLFRAINWRSTQLAVETITPLRVDDAAIERLAGAVRIPTVSVTETPGADAQLLSLLASPCSTQAPDRPSFARGCRCR